MGSFKNLINKKINKLTVIGKSASERSGLIRWNCICDCGNLTTVSTDHLTRKSNPVKSCGCEKRIKGNKHRDWKGCGDISGDWWFNHVKREINQKKRHKIDYDLTIEKAWDLFLKQNRKCALSGISLYFGNTPTTNCASLDRIDSSKGYTIDNVQWVHKHINFMKRNYSQDYFIEMCKKVAEYFKDVLE